MIRSQQSIDFVCVPPINRIHPLTELVRTGLSRISPHRRKVVQHVVIAEWITDADRTLKGLRAVEFKEKSYDYLRYYPASSGKLIIPQKFKGQNDKTVVNESVINAVQRGFLSLQVLESNVLSHAELGGAYTLEAGNIPKLAVEEHRKVLSRYVVPKKGKFTTLSDIFLLLHGGGFPDKVAALRPNELSLEAVEQLPSTFRLRLLLSAFPKVTKFVQRFYSTPFEYLTWIDHLRFEIRHVS